MKQNRKNSKILVQCAGMLLLALFLLVAYGENVDLAVSPVTPGTTVPTPATTPVLSTVSSITTNNSPVTFVLANSPAAPATTQVAQASSWPVVLVGELTYNRRATANSPMADWPELKYADGVGLNAHTKTIRLKLDETQLNELYSSGQAARLLVKGQRIAANGQGEEALQVSFLATMGHESQHQVGTLKYQAGGSGPELLFSPEGSKSSLAWHLLLNTALVNQLGDLAFLDGKRVLLDNEIVKGVPDTFYVSRLEPLSRGQILQLKADSLGTFVADGPGPTNVIGTNSHGYSLADKVSGQTFYLILAEGIKFDATNTRAIIFNGEKLVSEKGQDLGGLLFITSLTS